MTYIFFFKDKGLKLIFTNNYDTILGIIQKILQKLLSREFRTTLTPTQLIQYLQCFLLHM